MHNRCGEKCGRVRRIDYEAENSVNPMPSRGGGDLSALVGGDEGGEGGEGEGGGLMNVWACVWGEV